MKFSFPVNSIIKTLVLSDFFLLFSIGILAPVFALFIVGNIEGATIQMVGFAAAAYWTTRVVSVFFVTRVLDTTKGNRDEYFTLVSGTFLIALVPLLYLLVTEPWHLYVVQAVNGFANSLAVPAWRISFTRFVNRRAVGQAWSLDDISVGLATAASGALGGVIAGAFGFTTLFIIASASGFIATMVVSTLYRSRAYMGPDAVPAEPRPNPDPASADAVPPLKVDSVK